VELRTASTPGKQRNTHEKLIWYFWIENREINVQDFYHIAENEEVELWEHRPLGIIFPAISEKKKRKATFDDGENVDWLGTTQDELP
jgi:hypothetical protein